MPKAKPKASAPYNPPPPGGFPDLCGVCRRPLELDGKCADCGGWPFSTWLVDRTTGDRLTDERSGRTRWSAPIPTRACPACGGPVDVSGGCDACEAQVGPSLIHPLESPVRGIWIEAEGEGPFPIPRVTHDQVKARIKAIVSGLDRSADIAEAEASRPSIAEARERFLRQHPDDDLPF